MRLRPRLALTAGAVGVAVLLGLAGFHDSQRRAAVEEALRTSALAMMQQGGRERCEDSPETWRGGARPGPAGGRALQGPPPGGGWGEGRPPPPPRGAPHPGPPPPGPPPFEGGRPPPGPGGWGRGPPPGGRPPPPLEMFAYDSALVASHPRAPRLDEAMRDAGLGGEDSVSRRVRGEGESSLEVLVRMPWGEGPCAYVLVRRPEPSGPLGQVLPPPEVWGLATLAVLGAMVGALGPVVRRVRRLTEEVRASAASGYASPVSVRGQDEVGELARAFQQAREEIRRQMDQQEAREQALRDFLANTTHDVMTPLTVLQGHLAAMQQRVGRGEAVEGALVASAMQEAHYMASLVHNLSAAARMEAGGHQVQRGEVDLNALVARVVARHLPLARQQQVALESGVPEAPVKVVGDETLLEQAVSNIVFNGIRYVQAGGHVAVVLESTREGRFRLRVLDDGPGIAEEERARLLRRGARGSGARTRAPQGQGLGLHIAHTVAALHGWALELGPSDYGGLEACFAGPVG